ncbi:MAG: hypothetical protein A3E26_02840 [Chlamydiae bacterium RIFCSPHIGHO2_12_FULL_49_32]|nr:MAG: hypothetical protein A3E26_02840 [Chlamydiae bacterium RIFCSPHIGHO2_12_FULL_49_32]
MKRLLARLTLGADLTSSTETKFLGYGTFLGVFLPGFLMTLGMIIYLRLGWVVGQVGLNQTLCIIAISCLITLITALSISATATNGEVKGGGTYYIISRSLGVEFGAAIGIPLFLAQVGTIALCILGFSESLSAIFPSLDMTLASFLTLAVLASLALYSSDSIVKSQFIIFVVIILSLISLFSGGTVAPKHLEKIAANSFFTPVSFWVAFSIFFPAATGIEAAAALSDSLKNPKFSLPLGTIAVVLTSFCIYSSIAIFLFHHCPRSLLVSDPLATCHLSRVPFLLILGIWGATLSSSISGLLSAPRILDALALDGVFPAFIAKKSKENKEPRIALVITLLLSSCFLYFGSINTIISVMTMFILITYGAINLATGLEELMGNPSWRPEFRVPWYISVGGALLALMAMFLIDPVASFLAIAVSLIIYAIMRKRHLNTSWEDIQTGVLLFFSRFFIYRLKGIGDVSRSWRPNFLVFSDTPLQLSNLIQITSDITRRRGFLTLVSIFSSELADFSKLEKWKGVIRNFLKEHRINALVELAINENVLSGVETYIKSYGLGPIEPNTVVFNEGLDQKTILDHLKLIQLAYSHQKNVVIFKDSLKNPVQKTQNTSFFTSLIGEKPGDIHLLWDDEHRNNSHLMLVLATMLNQHPKWKKGEIVINCTVSSEAVKRQRALYFENYFKKIRLKVKVNFFVTLDPDEWFSIAPEVQKASLVFAGLPPLQQESSLETYRDQVYVKRVAALKRVPDLGFVMASQQLDFSQLFSSY